MPKSKYFSTDLKNKIVELYKSGYKQIQISKNLNILKGTVSKIIRKFNKTGNVSTAFKSGRPRDLCNRTMKVMKRISMGDPRKTSTDISREMGERGISVSARTVRRRLDDMGLFGRVAVKKPLISKKNRMARFKFAQDHLTWSYQKWNTVLFSDESKFQLFGSDGRRYVRRPKGTRYSHKYQMPTVKHGGGSIMVWGCFSRSGVGPLVKIDGIMDRFLYKDILENNMLPHADEEMPLRWLFQQDNDPKHKSRFVQNWLNEHNVPLMDWPSQSPDLNPIENLWDHLDSKIRSHSISNKNELWEVLKTEWAAISSKDCTRLIDSMPRRCREVINSKGYSTKY